MEEKCVEGRAERRLLEVGEEDEDEEEQYAKKENTEAVEEESVRKVDDGRGSKRKNKTQGKRG